MSDLSLATLAHDKNMARDFLAGLDPKASKFTFQFFSDVAEWLRRNFPWNARRVMAKGAGAQHAAARCWRLCDYQRNRFNGPTQEKILCGRAASLSMQTAKSKRGTASRRSLRFGTLPSMTVNSGRGTHFYFLCEVPLAQFSALQNSLIDKLGTDAAVKDLPRVMRIPGTLHLKDPIQTADGETLSNGRPRPALEAIQIGRKIRVIVCEPSPKPGSA